jgi:tRNA-dihydrouridine synthase B
VRTARKHIIWYTRRLVGGAAFCERMNRIDEPAGQIAAVDDFLREHGDRFDRLHEANSPVH